MTVTVLGGAAPQAPLRAAGVRAPARLLWGYLRPYRRDAAAGVLLQIVQSIALLTLPALNADIIDNGVLRHDTGRVISSGAVMAALAVIQVAATIGALWFSTRAAMAVGRDLRDAVFEHVQLLSTQEVERFGVTSLVTRLSNDVQQVQTLLLSTLTLVVTAPVMAVGGIGMAFLHDAALAWVSAALLPVLGVVVALLVRRMRPLSSALQQRIDRVATTLREQITGLRVTRVFVKERDELRRFERVNGELTDASVRLGRTATLMLPLVVNAVNVCGVALVWVAARRVEDGTVLIGSLPAMLTYLVMVQGAVLSAAFVLNGLPRAEVCAERLRQVLDTRPALAAPAAPVTRLPRPGQVELRDVRFAYPGAQDDVLHGVTLTLEPGSTTAVIGSTGSGKTTLLRLICRLAAATAGEVRVGGADVAALDAELLSRTVGLVPQQPSLFSGTVASNLRFGRPDATDDRLWRALETAQAKDFVAQLDGGLDARISQGGGNLSGGQRQRLAIARTLLHRPDLYLFDDSFSSLDFTTDAALRDALARETADATVVMVAQRVSTVMDADRIVVLDGGAVAGHGTHEELMRDSPVYREIVASQLGEDVRT